MQNFESPRAVANKEKCVRTAEGGFPSDTVKVYSLPLTSAKIHTNRKRERERDREYYIYISSRLGFRECFENFSDSNARNIVTRGYIRFYHLFFLAPNKPKRENFNIN